MVVSPAVLTSGADPTLSIGDNIPAGIGGPVVIPVNIAIDPNITLYSATYTVQYDPAKLSFVGVAGAGVFSGWSTVSGASAGTITILMSDTNGHPTGGSIENVQLANITFNVLETFTGSTSNLNIAPVNSNEGGVLWSNNNVDDGSVQFVLLGDYNQNGIVDTADRTVWRNTIGQSVTPYSGADGNGNGVIDNDDFNLWRSHFGLTAVPGPGAGAGDELAASFSMSAVSPECLTASVASGMDIVETTQSVVAVALASSDESARDEAFGEVVESVEVARTFARTSSKVNAPPTVGATYAANNLLASLASAEDRRHEDGTCLAHDDSDVEAVDELFASLDDESLTAALSL